MVPECCVFVKPLILGAELFLNHAFHLQHSVHLLDHLSWQLSSPESLGGLGLGRGSVSFCLLSRHFLSILVLDNRSSLILLVLLDFLIGPSFFLPFLLSSSLPVDGLNTLPKSKLEPVENEEDGKDKLNKAEGKSDGSNGKSGIVLCLKVLDVDLVEIANKNADDDRKVAGNIITVFHFAFS